MCLKNLHILAYATLQDLKIDQMDVDSAFHLQVDLSKTVFVKQPEGFVSQTHPDYVCKLNKSLYGLKQALLMWNYTLDSKCVSEMAPPPVGDDVHKT